MKKNGEKMLTEPEMPNSTFAWTWKNEAHSSRDMLFKNISRIKSIKKKKKRIITNVWLSEVADKREKIEPSDYSAFSHQQLEELMNNIIILLKGMK